MAEGGFWNAGAEALIGAAAFGYVLGAIPFGLIFTRLAGLGDIRKVGSGNIGATNVLRTGRKGLAAATLLADAGKATAAALIAGLWSPAAGLVAGVAAVVGHIFPVWLGFKGGKGVATYLGALIGAVPLAGAAFATAWLACAALTRYSSLSALVAALAAPAALAFLGEMPQAAAFAVLSLLIYQRHSANIGRLIRGEEPKIGANKTK